MRRLLSVVCVFGLLSVFLSCKEKTEKDQIGQLLKEWSGKEIKFPEGCVFSVYGKDFVYDTVPRTEYKIVTYIDSLGCSSCKLRLPAWKEFIRQLDSLELDVPVLFFLHPNNVRIMKGVLRMEKFDYPVCLDLEDKMNRLNHFPSEYPYQTFLLDKDNRVVVVGNPVYSSRMKELYLNRLMSVSNRRVQARTTVSVPSQVIDFGEFHQEKRDTTIYLKNVGENPLIVLDAVSSCGCTIVNYERKLASPGDSLAVHLCYKAEQKGPFYRTVHIYCNIDESVLQFELTGKSV